MIAFKINLDSHHVNHANSKLHITPEQLEIENFMLYVKKIREMAKIYARLMIQYKYKYQTVFSSKLYK